MTGRRFNIGGNLLKKNFQKKVRFKKKERKQDLDLEKKKENKILTKKKRKF